MFGEKPIYNLTIQRVHLEENTKQASEISINNYRRQIGSLIYLISTTRPDLVFSVSNCARYMSNLSTEHYEALARIWQYVRTTKNYRLLYNNKHDNLPKLVGYVDSD